ncbi:hypothetical protein T01_7667 [Trichinella spiralis]|uniref:Uncharacterized protein n=1 Tax=Trichinella spiralis TaxID=6334 RepID=A0A0V1B237_TRISP|nr:hypothetical protein T01_7667 [Trichinella spiralis]
MKFEAKCISAETQHLYANRCATVYELERKYCYEILKKEKLISLVAFAIYLNHLSTSGQMTITTFFKHGSIRPLFGYVFSICKSEYDTIIQLNCHTNTTTSGFAHILNLTFSIFITFFVLYTEKTLFGYCNFMDNNKPITETDKDIQSVSKSDLLIDQLHFEICKDPVFVGKEENFDMKI